MTVKEYLEIHSSTDIESIGIYSAIKINGTDVIDTNVKPIDLIKYLKRVVDHVSLGIFDETRKAIDGTNYNAKFIRACIYVR